MNSYSYFKTGDNVSVKKIDILNQLSRVSYVYDYCVYQLRCAYGYRV